MPRDAIIGANSQGGGRRVGDDVLVGGVPFVKTGDCTDAEVRDNHAKALVTALELGSRATTLLVGLEKTVEAHQTKVCLKLQEIQNDLKRMTDRQVAGDQLIALMQRDVTDNARDIQGIGTKVRSHLSEHQELAGVKKAMEVLDKHLEWHQHVKDVEEDRKFQLFNSIRVPILRWLIIGVVSLALLGAVITAFTTLAEVLPSLGPFHHQ